MTGRRRGELCHTVYDNWSYDLNDESCMHIKGMALSASLGPRNINTWWLAPKTWNMHWEVFYKGSLRHLDSSKRETATVDRCRSF